MKIESNTKPDNFDINIKGNSALLFLREGIIKSEKNGLVSYRWDEYEMSTINREGLRADIEKDFPLWIATAKAVEIKLLSQKIRDKRDALLAECDYMFTSDYPLKDRAQWAAYRQALRDITLQKDFPTTAEFPVKP
ncbi:MAG: tail fiber assembly protein [Oscillospiraceae bacterium]